MHIVLPLMSRALVLDVIRSDSVSSELDDLAFNLLLEDWLGGVIGFAG
jgi:hypothetical protein